MSEVLSFVSEKVFLGIALRQYALAFLVIFLSFVLRKVVVSTVFKVLKRATRRTAAQFDEELLDAIQSPVGHATVWGEYLRVRQEINLQIMKLLESLGMEVAFPTRTVYLKNEDEERKAS